MSDDAARRRRGIAWILVTIVSTAAVAVLAHAASQRMDWRWVLLVRALAGCGLAWMLLRLAGAPRFGNGARAPLATMSLLAGASAGAYFFALAHVPSADAMVLRGAAPLWIVVAAWVLLGQAVPGGLWIAVACGFVGMVLVQQPHLSAGNVGVVAGVAAGLLAAASQDALRRLRHVPAVWTVFALSWAILAVAIVLALAPGRPLDASGLDDIWAWAFAGGTAVFGTVGSIAVTRAVALTSNQRVSASTYAAVGLGAIADVAWFSSSPSAIGIAGLALTTVPTMYVVFQRPATRGVLRATFPPMPAGSRYLDPERIADRLRAAERCSACEFRVHVEVDRTLTRDVLDERFEQLGIARTRLRNGVLVVLAPTRGELCVVVDAGILEVASTRELRRLTAAAAAALAPDRAASFDGQLLVEIAGVLAQWFPFQEDDVDELPNDLSIG